ncbi:putative amidoligase enzyme-domain-containing protein [Leptodontidium sp. MPI-SDFR-AT-0119]|nr:putative amidoligase enzyme-domain-containing protein [Leptodontidium sp. MPI-SDFR-AT-0119]
MSSALTFGVELEFLMAYLPDNTPPPDPSETRLLRFEYTDHDIAAYLQLTKDTSNARDTNENGGRFMCAKRHIRNILTTAGLPVIKIEQAEHDPSDFSGWDIVEDTSIDKPENTPYRYFQLEVRSPAYISSPSALLENFCLLTVDTSSLHVHVGDGLRSFDSVTMRKLAAFIWAFEPQLHSIHPPHRQTMYYATGMRACSRYSTRYRERYGYDTFRIPNGITGALDLLACEDVEALCEEVKDASGYLKTCQVSFSGILAASMDPDREHGKRTVEWRQHAGTLDGEEVAMWVETVVGIMYFVRDASMGYFVDVLAFALLETWQKLGDGRDGERERELGPILAEGLLPIDRLLRLLMLDQQAEFYGGRWYILPKTPLAEVKKSRMVWAYERESIPGSDEFEKCKAMRRLWEDLRELQDLIVFDPESSMWPSHGLRVDSSTESVDDDMFAEEYSSDTFGDLGVWAALDGETETEEFEEEEERES